MKEEKLKGEKLFLFLAVVAVGVSFVAMGMLYFSLSAFFGKINAFVTTGEVNLTVETLAQINFTINQLNFGSGRVNSDVTAASLITDNGFNPVTGGNWTFTGDGGLYIKNIGNVNVTLNLTGTKTAAQFIGGSNPVYKWNISATAAGGAPNSCLNKSGKTGGLGGLNLNAYHNVNTSIGDSMKCFVFRFENTVDSIRIDFNLTVPQDSTAGALGDVITATVYAQNPTGSG